MKKWKKRNSASKEKITRKTLISEILLAKPELATDLFQKGVHCVGCFFAQMETIEQGLKAHGFSDKEIDNFIKKANK